MATTLLIIFILAIIHFSYENIIAPTLRIYQRNKLFALRDELRNVDFYALNKQDKQAFEYVENSLTNCIQNLPYMNIYSFTRYKHEYAENEHLRNTVKEKIDKITNCSISEIKNVFNDAGEVVYHTIWINSGMWFLYLIPIALILILCEIGIKLVKKMIVSPLNIDLQNNDNLAY